MSEINPIELWDWAKRAWYDSQTDEERADISESKTGEFNWSQGFVRGLAEAIKQMQYFGLSDDEIRTALGMVKK